MTSVLKVDNIQNSSGTQAINIHSSGLIIPSAGGIIQTQYTQFTGTAYVTTNANVDVALSDLTVNITPTSTSSKLKVEVDMGWEGTESDHNYIFFLYRDSTALKAPTSGSRTVGIRLAAQGYHADDASSTPTTISYKYYDEPNTTSQVTYKVGVRKHSSGTGSIAINRSNTDSDASGFERTISSITVTEIAG